MSQSFYTLAQEFASGDPIVTHFITQGPIRHIARSWLDAIDVKVTVGTNTNSKWQAMSKPHSQACNILGALHEASYVVVYEVPAAAWGYTGQTQEHRFIAGRINAAA